MPYYRILQNISLDYDHRIPRGSIQRLTMKPAHIERLVAVGAISRIATPPLDILPGWEERAKKLRKLNVITVEDLMDALEDRAAAIIKAFELAETDVLQWQQELIRDWLTI